MGRRTGREWTAHITPVARTALKQVPSVAPWVAAFAATMIASRAQALPQLRYAGAAVVVAITLSRPALSAPALIGLLSGSPALEPIAVGFAAWAAVLAGRLHRGNHPLFAGVWTVFTISLVVGSILTSDAGSIPGRFFERIVPASLSMVLCWAVAKWSRPQAAAGRAPPPGLAVAAGLLVVVMTAGIVGSGPAVVPVTVGLASLIARWWPRSGPAGAVAVMTVTAVAGYGFGLLAWPAVLLICLVGVAIGVGQDMPGAGLMAGSIVAHAAVILIAGWIEPWELAASWAGSAAGILAGSLLSRTGWRWWTADPAVEPGPQVASLVLGPIAAMLVDLASAVERGVPVTEPSVFELEDIRREVCGGCAQVRGCWDTGRTRTVDALQVAAAEEQRLAESPPDALRFCRRPNLLTLGLGMAIRAAARASEAGLEQRQVAQMTSGQLRDVGRLLQSSAELATDTDRGRAALRYTVGVSGGKRTVKRESWNSFWCENGRGVLVIGVAGSPEGRAAPRSACRLMIGTAHRMVAAGFSPLTAARAANLVSSTGPGCVLDLAAIDLHTGELEVIQVGLTVAILMRLRRMEAIWRHKPGSAADRDAVVVRRVITPGDVVVLMTNTCPDRSLDGMDATLTDLAARYREQPVKRLADSLSTEAAGGRSGEMVTIAVRVDLAT